MSSGRRATALPANDRHAATASCHSRHTEQVVDLMNTRTTILLLLVVATAPAAAQPGGDIVWMRGGHTAAVKGVAFTGDSRQLVSVGLDRVLRVWDPDSRLLLFSLPIHGSGLTSLARSGDGRLMAAGDIDGRVHIIDPRTWSVVRSIRVGSDRINAVKLSARGDRLLAASTDHLARILDVTTGAELVRFAGHTGQVTDADLSANDSIVATASDDFTTRIWDAHTGAELRSIQEVQFATYCVALDPDNRHVAALGYDPANQMERYRGICIFDVITGEKKRTLGGVGSVQGSCLVYSPDGRFLVIGVSAETFGGLEIVDLDDTMAQPWSAAGMITSAAFSPDGRRFAWAASDPQLSSGRFDGSSVPTVTGPGALLGHTSPVRALSISPAGLRVSTVDSDGFLNVFDVPSGLRAGGVWAHWYFDSYWWPQPLVARCVAWSSDGARIVTGSDDGTIKVWRSDNLTPRSEPERTIYVSSESPVTSAVMMRSGRIVAGVGAFDSVALHYDTVGQRPLFAYRGNTSWINAVALSPDERALASAGEDGTVRIWDAATGALLASSEPEGSALLSVVFSTDGTLVFAGAEDGTLLMIEAVNGATIFATRGHSGEVTGVDVTSNGLHLISGSLDSTVAVWSIGAEDIAEVFRYRDYPAGTTSVGISDNTGYVLSGTDDATVIARRLRTVSSMPERPISSAFTTAVHPLPAHDVAWLDLTIPRTGVCVVHLEDATGRLLGAPLHESINAGNRRVRIPVESLPQGLYFLEVNFEGSTRVERVVKY